MKILLVNTVCGQGSTGRICIGIADMLKANGHEAYIAYGLGNSTYPGSINISEGRFGYLTHNVFSRLLDSEGLHSRLATKRLLKYIGCIKPDIVHIHTMHGHYLNYKLLFEFLKKAELPVVMTLHDCWTFTGHCAHFIMRGCEKWKTGCDKCNFLDEYPQSWFVDKSKRNYQLKKSLFTSLGNKLTIVPVSYWLEGLVRQSFLKNKKIQTIHNGIDLSVFKPTANSNIRKKYGIENKKVIIGVALPWSSYKGYPDFLKLRELLTRDYAIIMVGLSNEQMAKIPNGIIGITRTDSPTELAEFYTIADVLVNTTYCDNYPTINLESMACGTPVITYRTGGSPESIDYRTGAIVEQGDIQDLIRKIRDICEVPNNYRTACIDKAKRQFDKGKCFANYLNIYSQSLN
jgi:putative colanic acid biosynthesis glycosyltransferase